MSAPAQDRAAFIAALRHLAGVLEASPAIALPMASAHFTLVSGDIAGGTATVAAALGCGWQPAIRRGAQDWYVLRGDMGGGLKAEISAPAAQVCEPGGTQLVEVPGWAPIPAIAALVTPAEASR